LRKRKEVSSSASGQAKRARTQQEEAMQDKHAAVPSRSTSAAMNGVELGKGKRERRVKSRD